MTLEDDGTTLVRDGKHAVHVGDLVSVAGNPDSRVTDRGWRNAKVVRFWYDSVGNLVADVTRPKNRAGVRPIAADRLTRQSTIH